jgi:hypothetical protein
MLGGLSTRKAGYGGGGVSWAIEGYRLCGAGVRVSATDGSM